MKVDMREKLSTIVGNFIQNFEFCTIFRRIHSLISYNNNNESAYRNNAYTLMI